MADRFGYSTASVHQMATLLRTGKLAMFTKTRPGPKGPRKAVGPLRARVLALRAADHSVTEIAAALAGEGTPTAAQTVWQILDAEGLPRLPRRDETRRGSPIQLTSVKAAKLETWPTGAQLACDHVKDRGISSLSIIEIPHPVSTGGSGDYRVVVGGTSSLMRSATATGSSQCGQAPPRPTRWQNTPQSWQCCSPR